MTSVEVASRTVVVVGNGMVGHRFVESFVDRGGLEQWNVVVVGEEPRPAYDRVGLSTFFNGVSAEDLSLVPRGFYEQHGITLHLNDEVIEIQRHNHVVVTAQGRLLPFDALVLATGSYPFVPPLPGTDVTGCFVYRTIEDLEAIRMYAEHMRADGRKIGAVIGGGLLGLEAANALVNLGLDTHVVEFAERLMPLQVDEGGGAALRRRIESLGVRVHTSMRTSEIAADELGAVRAIRFDGAADLDVDLLVFSAGIRPRDALARTSDLAVGERGGITVDNACRTSDTDIYAIGECAHAAGRVWGLVAPGYDMARVAADRILNGCSTFDGADLSTKLKLMGVDVASFGDAFGSDPDALSLTFSDPVSNTYKRLVVDATGTTVVGGILVGDASAYNMLTAMVRGDIDAPARLDQLLLPPALDGAEGVAVSADGITDGMAMSSMVCSCNNVTKGTICSAITDGSFTEVGQVKRSTRAGSSCGGCMPMVTQLFKDELRRAGVAVKDDMCEHFAYTRQQLFDIIRIQSITGFRHLLRSHGRGLGCEICKPAVASMLASLNHGHILDGEQAALQDTNDHFLANIQKDGTYSVVPRIPGGEVTPAQLITIGEVARDFGLYTKITGGQRIDLFGARVEQLPAIWERLVAAGMESGHAYGKALRTVKSCVGDTWCRYGVQDSTTLAIQLELRYRGLRAPHKFKSAVSGCARECAEAQSKDFGIIATERGWNLYVGGNGGQRPQHATLLAEDLDTDTLIGVVDRFLMFYIRSADRLERTATWLNRMEGGVDYLRRVIIDDELGVCADLDAAMATHIAGYECEWKATLASPERLSRFRSFVNADVPDPTIVHVRQRGQIRPATIEEKLTIGTRR